MAKDPVCGMSVDDKAPLKSTYAGKNYLFCSASCKEKFDKEPGRARARCRGRSPTRKADLMHGGGWLGMGGMGVLLARPCSDRSSRGFRFASCEVFEGRPLEGRDAYGFYGFG